jgi:hypothetical protein
MRSTTSSGVADAIRIAARSLRWSGPRLRPVLGEMVFAGSRLSGMGHQGKARGVGRRPNPALLLPAEYPAFYIQSFRYCGGARRLAPCWLTIPVRLDRPATLGIVRPWRDVTGTVKDSSVTLLGSAVYVGTSFPAETRGRAPSPTSISGSFSVTGVRPGYRSVRIAANGLGFLPARLPRAGWQRRASCRSGR